MNGKIPKECRSCLHFHSSGVKEGGYDRWCCNFGKPTYRIIGHCRNKGGYQNKEEWKKEQWRLYNARY